MNRTERQNLCCKRWLEAGGTSSITACTGFGKTRVALNIIDLLIHSNPEAFALIVVPTEVLKKQWTEQLEDRCLIDNCRIEIINSVIKKNWECDLLIIDEILSM